MVSMIDTQSTWGITREEAICKEVVGVPATIKTRAKEAITIRDPSMIKGAIKTPKIEIICPMELILRPLKSLTKMVSH